MRIRDVASYASMCVTHNSEPLWENPELRRDFYTTIIKLCQKKEDLFLSEKHDANKVLGDFPKTHIATTAIDEAKDIVYGDRESTYGRPDKNLRAIAFLWQDYLVARFGAALEELKHQLKPSDVAIMMVLLKVARHANKYTRDTIVDGIGYFALVDRIKEELEGE